MKNTGSTRGSCHVEWVTVPVHLPAKWLVFGASSVYKITKPLYASLRAQGHLSVGHIDDSLIVIYKGKARLSAMIRCRLQRKHLIMCVFASTRTSLSKKKATKRLDFLGFTLCSVTITLSLTVDRAQKIQQKCLHMLNKQCFSIQELAEFIGLLVESFPPIKYAQLYYSQVEIEKAQALKRNCGNSAAHTCISGKAR